MIHLPVSIGPEGGYSEAVPLHPPVTAVSRILIVSDAWEPQVNGVVTTLKSLVRYLRRQHTVELLTPDQFGQIPTFYPHLHLAVPYGVEARIASFRPDRIFIATEGPLGLAARWYCVREGIPFVTSYTTRWPEYFHAHLKFPPVSLGYRYMRWFHAASQATMVATPSLRDELSSRGFGNLVLWSRGVDLDRFRPLPADEKNRLFPALPRPFYLYVGRVSQEKNLDAFLSLDLPGTKIVVGDGPYREELMRRYPGAVFTGSRRGAELALTYASCDVFVFPSVTDTFGLVMLEALASGLPVAAFDVTGPRDVIRPDAGVGFLAPPGADLRIQALQAWDAVRNDPSLSAACRRYAADFSWDAGVSRLLEHLPLIEWEADTIPLSCLERTA